MIRLVEEGEELVALSSDPTWRDTKERELGYTLPLDGRDATKQCHCLEDGQKPCTEHVQTVLSSVTVGGVARAARGSMSRLQSNLSASPPAYEDIIAPTKQMYDATKLVYDVDLNAHDPFIEYYDDEEPAKVQDVWEVSGRTSATEGTETTYPINPSHIESKDPQFVIRTLQLFDELKDVLSTTLPREPAGLPPFEIEVDRAKWETYQTQGPPDLYVSLWRRGHK